MGQFMGDDGLQLGSGFGLQDQAGVNKDMLGVDDKSVQLAVAHHDDLDAAIGQSGGIDQRLGQLLQGMFDIRVAQDGDGARGQGG